MSTNSSLVLPDAEGHWYDVTGKPIYEVLRADGQGTRPTTVRDARIMKLFPSVTSIINGILYKPGLEAWKIEQYILSALTLPRNEAESMDEFAKRVLVDGRTEARLAAEAGTRIHQVIEWWLTCIRKFLDGSDPDFDPMETKPDLSIEEENVFLGIREWIKVNKLEWEAVEHSFTHFANIGLGYGGRIDCIGNVNGNRFIIDWKTQRTDPKKSIAFYPEWGVQLAAYAFGINEPDTPGLSVVISRNEPGRIGSYVWTEGWRWPAFEALKYLYYTPLGQGYRLAHGQ